MILVAGLVGTMGSMAAECGALIVADGDLPSLLACAAAARDVSAAGASPGSVAWIPLPGGHTGTGRAEAAHRQAELYGLEVAADDPPHRFEPVLEGWDATVLLLRACQAASVRGIRSVNWPVHAGPELDLDRVSRAVERCLLVTRLAGIDPAGSGAPIEVRAPYADFTDDQVADLVLDMDLPVRTCWWWEPRTPAARAARERWGAALARAGWMDLPASPTGGLPDAAAAPTNA